MSLGINEVVKFIRENDILDNIILAVKLCENANIDKLNDLLSDLFYDKEEYLKFIINFFEDEELEFDLNEIDNIREYNKLNMVRKGYIDKLNENFRANNYPFDIKSTSTTVDKNTGEIILYIKRNDGKSLNVVLTFENFIDLTNNLNSRIIRSEETLKKMELDTDILNEYIENCLSVKETFEKYFEDIKDEVAISNVKNLENDSGSNNAE